MKDERKFSNFILLWATQTLSRLGSSLTPFALILWAYGETGSAFDTALLTVSSYVPYILLSLPYSRGIMHAHDTLRMAFRESGAMAPLSGELYHRDGSDIPAAGKRGRHHPRHT